MPLSTVLFRIGRLESRGHAERIPNPDDRRSYLVRLTDEGQRLLAPGPPALPRATPRRSRPGSAKSGSDSYVTGSPDLREAIEQELSPE